jgi:hypothetical protein
MSSKAPGFFYNENVDRLVLMGLLTKDEAERAKKHDVKIGDADGIVMDISPVIVKNN